MYPILRDAAKWPLLWMRPRTGLPLQDDFGAGEWRVRRYNHPRNKKRRERNDRETPEMSAKLKIHVDQDKCQGHARCKSLAPELFELDEFGNAHEIGDGTVPKGLEDKAWLAQANCPEIAIEVTEE